MLIDLQEETRQYWKKLDKLENAYQEGKVSIEEVDAEVASLMADLGKKRRIAMENFLQVTKIWLIQQRETLTALAILGTVAYLWFVNSSF
jgi:hypothetical protein